jgi:hypothetical protein
VAVVKYRTSLSLVVEGFKSQMHIVKIRESAAPFLYNRKKDFDTAGQFKAAGWVNTRAPT